MDIKVGDIVKSTLGGGTMYSINAMYKLSWRKHNLYIIIRLVDVDTKNWSNTSAFECLSVDGELCYNIERFLEKVC